MALLVLKQVESVIVMQSAFTLGTAIVGAPPALISIVQRPAHWPDRLADRSAAGINPQFASLLSGGYADRSQLYGQRNSPATGAYSRGIVIGIVSALGDPGWLFYWATISSLRIGTLLQAANARATVDLVHSAAGAPMAVLRAGFGLEQRQRGGTRGACRAVGRPSTEHGGRPKQDAVFAAWQALASL